MKRYCGYELQLLRYRSEATRLRGHAPFDADPTWTPFHLLGLSMTFRDRENAAWLGEIVIESRTKRCRNRARRHFLTLGTIGAGDISSQHYYPKNRRTVGTRYIGAMFPHAPAAFI
jgi:hypothetical protein